MTSSTKGIPSPKDRNSWNWGFTPQAELWNGRIAMIGFMAALLTELLSNQGVLHFWNLMETSTMM
jgi:Chlorophyll A-B binding protein